MKQVVASNEEKPEVGAVEVSKDYGPKGLKNHQTVSPMKIFCLLRLFRI
jgi:hypothetical protein